MSRFFCTFEDTDLATLAHLEITVAKCGKYSSTLAIICNNKLALNHPII